MNVYAAHMGLTCIDTVETNALHFKNIFAKVKNHTLHTGFGTCIELRHGGCVALQNALPCTMINLQETTLSRKTIVSSDFDLAYASVRARVLDFFFFFGFAAAVSRGRHMWWFGGFYMWWGAANWHGLCSWVLMGSDDDV